MPSVDYTKPIRRWVADPDLRDPAKDEALKVLFIANNGHAVVQTSKTKGLMALFDEQGEWVRSMCNQSVEFASAVRLENVPQPTVSVEMTPEEVVFIQVLRHVTGGDPYNSLRKPLNTLSDKLPDVRLLDSTGNLTDRTRAGYGSVVFKDGTLGQFTATIERFTMNLLEEQGENQ